jgi:Spy/CpxP family protein refolding chaperone
VFPPVVILRGLSGAGHGRDRPTRGAADTPPVKKDDVKARIGEMKKTLMTRALDLDQATIDKIVAISDRYEEKRKTIRQARRETLKSLMVALKDKDTTDSEIKAIIDKLTKNEDELYNLRRQEQKELSKILTSRELARYMIFIVKFNREVTKIIARKRFSRGEERSRKDKE